MQFTTLFTATLALAMGVVAADINPRLATLRIYGEPGCSALNEGEIGVFKDMQNKCQTFLASDNVRSINLESLYGVGCKLAVYEDVTCHLGGHVDRPVGQCLSGAKAYGSYRLDCPV